MHVCVCVCVKKQTYPLNNMLNLHVNFLCAFPNGKKLMVNTCFSHGWYMLLLAKDFLTYLKFYLYIYLCKVKVSSGIIKQIDKKLDFL